MAAFEKSMAFIRRNLKRILIIAPCLIFLYTIAGFFAVPAIIKAVVPEKVSAAIQRPFGLGDVAFNPFTLRLQLNNASVGEPDGGEFVSVGSITANAEIVSALTFTPTLKSLVIDAPAIKVIRNADGSFNFSDLLALGSSQQPPSGSAETPASTPTAKPVLPAALLKHLRISNARLQWQDNAVSPGFATAVTAFDLVADSMGTRAKEPGTFRISLETDLGVQVKADGEIHLAALSTNGNVQISGVQLSPLSPYVAPYFKGRIESGAVGLAFNYQYPAGEGGMGLPAVRQARFNLDDLRVASPKGDPPLVSLRKLAVLDVNLEPTESQVAIDSIVIAGARAEVSRTKGGTIDLLDLVSPPEAATAPNGPTPAPPVETSGDTTPWRIGLTSLSVSDVSASITDNAVEEPATLSVGGIDMGLSGLMLAVGSGMPSLETAQIAVSDIRLRAVADGSEMVEIPQFSVTGVQMIPEQNTIQVAAIASSGGGIQAIRNAAGKINLLNALLPKTSSEPPAQGQTPPAKHGSNKDPFDALPFSVLVETTAVSDIRVQFTDKSLREDAKIQIKDIDLTLKSLSTQKDNKSRLNVAMVGARDGTFKIKGDIAVHPPSATLHIQSEGLSIIPVQPYFSEKVSALITKGKFDAEGTLTADVKKDLNLRFTGKAAANNFGSVDKKTVKDLLTWESLYLSGIDISLMPLKVRLEEVALTDYYARVAVNPDGSVNLKDVLLNSPTQETPSEKAPVDNKPKEPVETATGKGSMPDIKIAKITLQGGKVDFSDNSVQPPFDTEMLDLGGTISGLSSDELARANVFLAGRLENQSPLKITGEINPLIEDQYTDIQIEFGDIDLSPFSPYTGKYLGRQLDKGKLTLVLGYKISDKKLAGDHKVFLDQFTLGDSVDSPDAISLPVDLAVALLKDSSGRIQLDLPVRGSLDDPQFSIAGVIFQVLLGTITKIITAPFAALGSALSGGPELSYVDFESGSPDLTPEATSTLEQLVAAMVERPGVAIEVQGQVNPEPDALSLRDRRLKDQVKSEKLRDLLKKDPSTPPEAAESLSAEEFAAYIKRIYDRADFPKPRNPDGSEKVLPPEEMEKLIYTSIQITDADLRRLAMNRAEAATEFILADERIDSGRVFLREPDMTPERDADGTPEALFSRVNFAIRQ